MDTKKASVGIVGYGYVGKAMANFFKDHYNVLVYDPAYSPVTKDVDGISFVSPGDINNCLFSVVCVPTPRADDGSCDLTYVNETFRWLDTDLIILKSTVDIGTTERLNESTGKNIVFSPEFAGESTYWSPYTFHTEIKETPFFIFGGDPTNTAKAVRIYMTVVGPSKTYRQVQSTEAEAVKYLINTFYALKITFCYEMNEIFKNLDLDYDRIRDLWIMDPRMNPMHTAVFFQNDAPFGGKCFPKDVSALVSFSKRIGYDADFLQEILSSNKRLQDIRKERKGGAE